MTPQAAADLTVRWVRLYTRRLPTEVADRRVAEISADLHDHITHERARGTDDRRIALSVLSRLIRGLAADAVWRNGFRPWTGDTMKSTAVAVLVIAVGVAAILYGGRDDSPGMGLIGFILIFGAIGFTARGIVRRRRR